MKLRGWYQLCRMEVEGKNCNAEKRAGYVPGHQLNQRYATKLCQCISCSSYGVNLRILS